MIKIKKINKINDISTGRFIFFVCSVVITVNKGNVVSLINDTIKTVNDENMDETEEYLNIKETTIHVKINNKLNCKDKANNIPKYVATPFPPLNFSHTGNKCPKKTNNEEKRINSGKYCFVIIMTTYPFKTSRVRVIAAKYLFPVLKTLVAPIFPDPISLTSFPVKIFVKSKPKGIEPIKYDIREIKKMFIFNYFL